MVPYPKQNGVYLIQDAAGFLWKVDLKKRVSEKVLSFHAGAIRGLDTSPMGPRFCSLGADGTLRLVDYVSKATIIRQKFSGGGTALTYAPEAVDPNGSTIATGFADGVVRILQSAADVFHLQHAFKPHSAAVNFLAYARTGSYFATAGADGTVFFFRIDSGRYLPLGFLAVPDVTGLSWMTGEDVECFVAQRDGTVRVFSFGPDTRIDNKESFALNPDAIPTRVLKTQRLMRPPPKAVLQQRPPSADKKEGEEKLAEVSEAEKEASRVAEEAAKKFMEEEAALTFTIKSIYCIDNGNFLISVELSNGTGEVYEYSLRSSKPLRYNQSLVKRSQPDRCIKRNDRPYVSVRLSRSKKYLLLGAQDGGVYFHPFKQSETNRQMDEDTGGFWIGHMHDRDYGQVRVMACSFDDAYFVSGGTDGGLFTYRVTSEEVKASEDPNADLAGRPPSIAVEDVTEPGTYTLQEAKIKSEKDKQLSDAEAKKQRMREYVQEVAVSYAKLLHANRNAPPEERLDPTTLHIDPGLKEQIESETQEKMTVARKEMEWAAAKEEIGLNKLKSRFVDVLEMDKVIIHAFDVTLLHHCLLSPFRDPQLSAPYAL